MILSEDTLFQGFSCPTEAFHESSLHLVAVQYARVVLEVFVGSFEAELKPYAGVTDKLEELLPPIFNSTPIGRQSYNVFTGHLLTQFCLRTQGCRRDIPSTHSREV